MQFERIFKYHERCKPLISRASAGLRIHYHRTGKILNGANYVQIKKNDNLTRSQPITLK